MILARIATLTMNPALDLSTATLRVTPEQKLRCQEPRHDPGGGGINVARAVTKLGGTAIAIYPAGGPNGSIVAHLLAQEHVPQKTIPIRGWTRESVTVQELTTGAQFRFVLPGPELSDAEQSACLTAVATLDPSPTFLVVSGSMPPGVGTELMDRLLAISHELGANLVVDVSGEVLTKVRGAYLIKPSLRELSELAGKPLDTFPKQVEVARRIVDEGRAEIVVTSLGSGGAFLVTKDISRRFLAPTVQVRSAVGAGDSMVAGILLSLAEGNSLTDAARFGVAAGTAAVLNLGTSLCSRNDTERLVRLVSDD
jgi:6-phosphofructokinase 2